MSKHQSPKPSVGQSKWRQRRLHPRGERRQAVCTGPAPSPEDRLWRCRCHRCCAGLHVDTGCSRLQRSLPLLSCFPSTQPAAQRGKQAENCPLNCGAKPGAQPCHPAGESPGGAAPPNHAACSCLCCGARSGGLLPSTWSSRARRCCEAQGDGLGQQGRLPSVPWGCQDAAQRLAQLDTVPRVGRP